MKRLNLLFVMLLALTVSAWGQTQRAVHKVQGIERADLTVPQVMNRASANTGIDFNSIQYWVGDGLKEAALAVKWYDQTQKEHVYVWGYKFSGNKTGADMISEIAADDPRFYLLVNGGTWSYTDSLHTDSIFTGDVIGGIGYNQGITYATESSIRLWKNNVQHQLNNGIYDCIDYLFDGWTTTPAGGKWNSGWYGAGYWSYWNADSVNAPYNYAQTGCTGRTLTPGCVDGWSFAASPGWSSTMTGHIVYVSEPSVAKQVLKAPKKAVTRAAESPTVIVSTPEELYNAIENATDGDYIAFDESLSGKVIEWPENYSLPNIEEKTLTVDGNGVILHNFHGFTIIKESTGTIRNFVFDDLKEPISVYSTGKRGVFQFANATIENCVFKNRTEFDNTLTTGTLIGISNTKTQTKTYEIVIRNCLFDNNLLRDQNYGYGNELIELFGYVNSDREYNATLVNNTFRGNKLGTDIIFSGNKVGVNLINNLFEDNELKRGECVVLNIGENNYFTSAYNVISGKVTESTQSRLSETDKWAVDLETSLENVDGLWQVKKDSPAYHNLPANTVIEGVEFPTTDIYGNAIDYTKPTQAGCSQLVVGGDEDVPAAVDYTAGTFLLNEDWYGHRNSTINFLTQEGEMIYRVIQRENEGVQLGCTAQYGTIYGGKIYITSKQEKDPGAKVVGGRLTIADARTMKVEKQFQTISANGYKGKADGRAFLGVNEHKGYMGTSNGIFILDLDELEFTDFIKVPGDDEDLYTGQVGNMVRAGDYVFANHQNAGLLVIDPETDQILQTIKPNDVLVSTMTLANDGNLWLMSGGKLVKLDPNTLEMETIELPSNVKLTSEGWGAWRASTFCASRQQNALYWVSADGALEDKGDVIFKYDIDKGEVSNFIQLPEAEGWSIYGSSFRIDPVTDDAILCLFKTYGSQDYITRKYNAQGEKILELEMEKNYWFPALPIYPDNALPVVTPLDAQTVALGETAEISLATLAEDADNMTAAIVKTVKAVSDDDVLSATIKGGKLILEGLKEGTATVTIQVNSNGQLAETEVAVEVTAPVSTVASFEEFALAPESYWAGDEDGDDWYYGLGYQQRFKSGQYSFVNYCIPDYQTWIGYAVSNQTSTDFATTDDQFKSCVGSGVGGSANYCVAYPDGTMWGETLSIEVEGGAKVVPGFYITNSAYVVNSITKGDSFAGDPFTVGDYFKVTIHALDADGNETATRDFCLADYRFEQEADRYYVNDWTYVDLSQLGEAAAFTFTFSGSRANAYGLTTPTYFCFDDFGAEGEETVREEGTYTGDADGITTIRSNRPADIYRLDGQRLNNANRPCIYIVNGRKVVIK